MMSQYGIFALETLTIVIAIIVVFLGVMLIRFRFKGKAKTGHLEIKPLNAHFDVQKKRLMAEVSDKATRKALAKSEKAAKKQQKKQKAEKKRLFVVNFKGDIQASKVTSLREEITAILQVATAQDQVLLRLESPGGVVHGYGLAASQLARLQQKGIPLTVAVDKVAASGGYMMACVANRIIAAPFAIIGSIGVVGQMPNFSRWLEQRGVDFEQHTAGEYKRTLTIFGKNTRQDREKFKEDLEETQVLFKGFVNQHRPQVDIDKVATGEHWFAEKAITMSLVDELETSDDYLLRHVEAQDVDVYEVIYHIPQSLGGKMFQQAKLGLQSMVAA